MTQLESRLDISLLFIDVNMDGLKLAHAVREQPSELPSNSCFFGKLYRAAAMAEQLRSIVGSA